MPDTVLDSTTVATQKTPFIVNRLYDSVFFIFSPLIALGLGVWASFTPLAHEGYRLNGHSESWVTLFSGTFTMAHLVIVFFRSHLNRTIFQLYPRRFIAAPLVLFAAMLLSSWILVFIFVLAIWWDVYHSSLQTFGFGRIYDVRAGNDLAVGRRLDWGLNLLLYIGPIFAGATLIDHTMHFDKFSEVGSAFFSVVPAFGQAHQKYFAWSILGFGVPYLVYYIYSYWRLSQKGYNVPPQKVWLLASTGLCSIYTWGFNSFGQAFFIMNFFHALQYFAIVWWTEKKNMMRFFGVQEHRWGKQLTLVCFLVLGFGYGLWAKFWGESNNICFSILLVVSIMHFWYDGFIWSVRKAQVKAG